MVLDFLAGRMPAYVDTGLNLVPVEDVAEGHWLAAEHGQIGARYLLGGVNLHLRDIWRTLARLTGRRAPSLRIPHAVAAAAAVFSEQVARARGREPRIPLDAVRMARHPMYADASLARRSLGFTAGSADAALERAVRWYVERGYARATLHGARAAAQRGVHA